MADPLVATALAQASLVAAELPVRPRCAGVRVLVELAVLAV